MELRAPQQRAEEFGADQSQLDEAEDKAQVATLAAAAAETERSTALKEELAAMKLRALQRRAEELGVDESELNDAEDKAEVIELILSAMFAAENADAQAAGAARRAQLHAAAAISAQQQRQQVLSAVAGGNSGAGLLAVDSSSAGLVPLAEGGGRPPSPPAMPPVFESPAASVAPRGVASFESLPTANPPCPSFERRIGPCQVSVHSVETSGEGVGTHQRWQIVSIASGSSEHNRVLRRYNDFVHLRTQLAEEVPGSVLPQLPEKNMFHGGSIGAQPLMETVADTLALQRHAFLESRRAGLEGFMSQVAAHNILRATHVFALFLGGTDSEWAAERKNPNAARLEAARIASAAVAQGVIGGIEQGEASPQPPSGIVEWMRTTAYKWRNAYTEGGQTEVEEVDPNLVATQQYVAAVRARLQALNLQLTAAVGQQTKIGRMLGRLSTELLITAQAEAALVATPSLPLKPRGVPAAVVAGAEVPVVGAPPVAPVLDTAEALKHARSGVVEAAAADEAVYSVDDDPTVPVQQQEEKPAGPLAVLLGKAAAAALAESNAARRMDSSSMALIELTVELIRRTVPIDEALEQRQRMLAALHTRRADVGAIVANAESRKSLKAYPTALALEAATRQRYDECAATMQREIATFEKAREAALRTTLREWMAARVRRVYNALCSDLSS